MVFEQEEVGKLDDGFTDFGFLDGFGVEMLVGFLDGFGVGMFVGFLVGLLTGFLRGGHEALVGSALGPPFGTQECAGVGAVDGTFVGVDVGDEVGDPVGT